MESLLNRLLKYFQISQDEYEKFLAPVSEENFAIGHSFKDIDKCVEVVKEAMKQNKKIYIYGDYDCDGI
ncbi:MAG: single-stranded-DNA-specific exonuclease RecJ, partial [Bacilli bacterium]|nr:single-stranded-DNA-specific exonuclease RecJ [Bacilli bacterium]